MHSEVLIGRQLAGFTTACTRSELAISRCCSLLPAANECWSEPSSRGRPSRTSTTRHSGIGRQLAGFTTACTRSELDLPLLLTSPGRKRVLERTVESRSAIANLYDAAQRQTGCAVLIDSSKDPLFGFSLTALEPVEVYFVHLVRDPRGVAFSGQRSRRLHGRRDRVWQSRSHPAKTSIMWNFWNFAARSLLGRDPTRYTRLRYEDLVESPGESLQLILSLVGEPRDSLPFVSGQMVRLGPSHTIGGNPARYRTGMVKLRPDNEWQDAMTLAHRSLVKALTWPLLGRYGY